jgi:hypothetical protein
VQAKADQMRYVGVWGCVPAEADTPSIEQGHFIGLSAWVRQQPCFPNGIVSDGVEDATTHPQQIGGTSGF